MKGIVEIYCTNSNEKLVEGNISVDGAGENIADFMTLSPDMADIASASAILDSSNYTIQAITFGKDCYAYANNAHDLLLVSSVLTMFPVGNSRVAVSSYSNSTVDSQNELTPFVSPLDTKLVECPYAAGIYGHNMNVPNYAIPMGLAVSAAIASGCYAYRSAGATDIVMYNATTSAVDASSRDIVSNFNAVSSMDYRGFCKVVSGTDSSAGMIVSSVSANEVAYIVTMVADDVATSDFYGGITSMGLWALDLSASLALGAPPFSFNPISPKRDYKLHSKVVFSKNIVDNMHSTLPGIVGYSDLLIVWRIRF
jgi:hypothetical protein